VNYVLSFLKDTALDYFEPYLVDDPADEPIWASYYSAFMDELYMYFSPYDQVTDAKVELEDLVMKDNHKATRFFVDSTELQPCSSTTIRLCIAEPIWLCRSESKTKSNPEAYISSETLSRRLTKGIGKDAVSSLVSLTQHPKPRPSTTSCPTKTEVPRTTTNVKVRVQVIPMPMPIWAKARKSRKETTGPTGMRNSNRTASVRTENSPPRNTNGTWTTSSA
jgi:hypothetical protein